MEERQWAEERQWGDRQWVGRRWEDHRWGDRQWEGRRWEDHRWEDHRWEDRRWEGRRWVDHRWEDRRWVDHRWEGCQWVDRGWVGRRPTWVFNLGKLRDKDDDDNHKNYVSDTPRGGGGMSPVGSGWLRFLQRRTYLLYELFSRRDHSPLHSGRSPSFLGGLYIF